MKIIVFKNSQGGVGVIYPAPEWFAADEDGKVRTIEELARKDVPAGVEWRIVEESALPVSRNWRNAWVDGAELVEVELTAAKAAHKLLMTQKAYQRVQPDAYGQRDFSTVQAEIAAMDFDGADDLQKLYNLWPSSIEKRNGLRTYTMHGEAA